MEPIQNRAQSRVITGLVLIAGGALLLAYKMGAPIPGWIFSWPVLLIVIGFFISLRHRFNNPGGLIMIAVGAIFLTDQLSPELNFRNFLVPVVVMLVGLLFVLRPEGGRFKRRNRWNDNDIHDDNSSITPVQPIASSCNTSNDEDDYIDSTAIFGGIKKIILSKNFKGGDITCFMGGAELNLMQADTKDKIVLDLTQIFGGTKLIVPPNWNIKSEVVAIFGGIEDKRPPMAANTPPDKVLVLKGTSVFGGIDIRSY